MQHNFFHGGYVPVQTAVFAYREACYNQTLFQVGRCRRAYGLSVAERAVACRVKQLVAAKFVHNAQHQFALVLQCHAYGKRIDVVQEISGAVKRVDNPDVLFG